MTAAERVIKKFGTASKLAKAIKRSRSCISHWKSRGGNVPAYMQAEIILVAKKLGIKITSDDLVNFSEK